MPVSALTAGDVVGGERSCPGKERSEVRNVQGDDSEIGDHAAYLWRRAVRWLRDDDDGDDDGDDLVTTWLLLHLA